MVDGTSSHTCMHGLVILLTVCNLSNQQSEEPDCCPGRHLAAAAGAAGAVCPRPPGHHCTLGHAPPGCTACPGSFLPSCGETQVPVGPIIDTGMRHVEGVPCNRGILDTACTWLCQQVRSLCGRVLGAPRCPDLGLPPKGAQTICPHSQHAESSMIAVCAVSSGSTQ